MIKPCSLLLLCLLPILGTAQTVETKPPSKEYPTNLRNYQPFPYEPQSSTTDGTKVERLAAGLLSLITGLSDEKDLTLKLIEKKLEVPFKKREGSQHSYIYWQKLNEDWAIDAFTHPYPYKVPRLAFSIAFLRDDGYSDKMGEVCIDLGRFQETLTRHGFRQSHEMTSGRNTIFYVSKDGRTHIDTSFNLEKMNGKYHECISDIDLTISNDEPILEEFKEQP